jgi:periplasmic divalent cation tolerance protein
MHSFIQIATTLPSQEQAMQIAQQLVAARLAACVQVAGPITSVYRWQGAVETASEWVCTAKTRQDLFSAVRDAICGSHPYDVPEVIATPLTDVDTGYADWLAAQVGPASA